MLPFGDINVVVLTDVHSWVAGHSSTHEPHLDANYGHVLSFYRHIQDLLRSPEHKRHNNLFFVMNGDFMDGTGLTTDPPNELIPILEHMPWDAVNIGNHELYMNSTVEAIVKKPGGFADWWGGRYLTSNVVLRQNGEPLGRRYTIMHGGDGTTKVIVFGFLYDMPDAVTMVKVEEVEQVIVSKWFRSALVDEKFDAILVLAHMHFQDEIVQVILEGIREVVGVKVPVQFITGHSHIRAYDNSTDMCSTSFEAGRYLDTVGFVSFSRDSSCEFNHVFVDGNIDSLRKAVDVETLNTDDGQALSSYIVEAQERMGLLEVVGCAPEHYSYKWNMTKHSNSFWRIYLDEIVPKSKLFQNGQSSYRKALLQDTGAFRYDMFEGVQTVNDVLVLSPFNDTFYLVGSNISGAVIKHIHQELTAYENQTMFGMVQSFPKYGFAPRGPIAINDGYELYSSGFGLKDVVTALHELHEIDVEPKKLEYASTAMIIDYISNSWPCSKSHATSGGSRHPSHPHFPVDVKDVIPERTKRSDITLIFLSLAYFAGVCAFLSYRRRKRSTAERMIIENSESELEPVTVAVFA